MGGVGQVLQKTYDVLVKGETPQAPQAPPPPPPPPSPTDPTQGAQTQASMQEAQNDERKSRGRASTYLTSSSGLSTAATTASRTLLGS